MHQAERTSLCKACKEKLTEKKLSKNVRNHQVMYTVTTIGKSTAQPPKNFRDSQLPNTLPRACAMTA